MAVSKRKPAASYVLKIVGNEHGTLQGTIQHTQSGVKHSFRGCLEMLQFIEEALDRPLDDGVVAERSELG